MNLKAFAVRDNKIASFKTPFYHHHTGEALRSWEDLANDPQSIVHKHPEDFSLYEIGEFNVDNGLMIPLELPHLLAGAKEQIRKPTKLRK